MLSFKKYCFYTNLDFSEQSEADLITKLSSKEPPGNQPNKRTMQPCNKKRDKIPEYNRTSSRYVRKCHYTGTYNVNNWFQTSQMKKTVKLKDRLTQIEKSISENKSTGITLDNDENEAKSFFDALGIRRIYPSHM